MLEYSPIISEFIRLVSFRSQLGQVNVAPCHTRSAHPCGSLHSQRDWVLIFVQDVTRGIWKNLAN